MHKWRKWVIGPFKQKCIYEWFKQEVYPLHFKQNLNKLKDAKQKSIEASKAKNKNKDNEIIKDLDEINYKNEDIPVD